MSGVIPVGVSGHVWQSGRQVDQLREAVYQVDANKGVLSGNKENELDQKGKNKNQQKASLEEFATGQW